MKKYGATWGTSLKLMSAFGTFVLLGVAATQLIVGGISALFVGSAALCVAILLAAIPFAVLGYGIEDDAIVVVHPGWMRRIPRAHLRSATYEPMATAGSIRTMGNGGLFSFSGWFRNAVLGSYRAYMTEPMNTVVLRFDDDRTIVITPDHPDAFVQALG